MPAQPRTRRRARAHPATIDVSHTKCTRLIAQCRPHSCREMRQPSYRVSESHQDNYSIELPSVLISD